MRTRLDFDNRVATIIMHGSFLGGFQGGQQMWEELMIGKAHSIILHVHTHLHQQGIHTLGGQLEKKGMENWLASSQIFLA